MVSSVTEQLMQALIVLLPRSLTTDAEERREQYGQLGH